MTGSKYSKLMLQKKQKLKNSFFSNFEIDHSRFKELWIESLTKREASGALFLLLDNLINYLDSILANCLPHPFLISLLRMIKKEDPDVSYTKYKLWIANTPSIKQEICFLILLRLNQVNKIPHQASPQNTFYFFIKDLKYTLAKEITKQKEFINPKIDTTDHYDLALDPLKGLGPWETYLSTLYISGYTRVEISQMTNLSRQTIYIEEKKLCHYLKEKLLKT